MIDSHCHLNDESFDNDRSIVVENALDNGIIKIVNIGSGYGFEGNYKSLEIAKSYPDLIFSTIGIHPHEAKDYSADIRKKLVDLYNDNREIIKAVGEIGLDFHYNLSESEVQRQVFREMIRLARELNLPVAIHSREAEPEVFNILKEEKAYETGGVMHCFSGTADEAKRYIEELGFYISFSGVITFKKADKNREAVKVVPNDRILVETDAPYLTPIPYRGKRNEPKFVRYTLEKVAELKEITFEEAEKITEENTLKFYNIK